MAKKLVFLLVTVLVLLLASVTALAVETQAPTPEAGFTKDKADKISVATGVSISVSELETKYSDLFFGDDTTEDKYVTFKYERAMTLTGKRYNITGTFSESVRDSLVILMYIKKDGVYVPLIDVDTGSNLSEGPSIMSCSKVDLELSNTVPNEIRIVAFYKKDALKLDASKVQVIDLKILAKPLTDSDKIRIITIDQLKDVLQPSP
jgi:hypothetical protein